MKKLNILLLSLLILSPTFVGVVGETLNKGTIPFWLSASTMISDGTFFATNGYRVYKSIDNTKTWKHISYLPRKGSQRAMYATSQDTLLVADAVRGTGGKIYRSTNGGLSWATSLTLGENECIFWSMSEYNGRLFVSLYTMWTSSKGHAKVLVSDDDGISWTVLKDFGSAYRHAHDIYVNPFNGYIYVCVGDSTYGLFRSIDSGVTWDNLYDEYLLASVHGRGDSNIVYFGRDGHPSLYKITDTGEKSVPIERVFNDHPSTDKNIHVGIWWITTVGGRMVFGEERGNYDGTKYPVSLVVSDGDWSTFKKVYTGTPTSAWRGFPPAMTDTYWDLSTIIVKVTGLDTSSIVYTPDPVTIPEPEPDPVTYYDLTLVHVDGVTYELLEGSYTYPEGSVVKITLYITMTQDYVLTPILEPLK